MRLGARYGVGAVPARSDDGVIGALHVVEGALVAGGQAIGPLGLEASLAVGDADARIQVAVANRAEAPLHLESVIVGLRWPGAACRPVSFLRHGWQSWSFSGGRPLDDAGEPTFPSGPWLRGLHHGVNAPPPDRAGWHESDLVSVARSGDGGVALAGVLERGLSTGLVYLRRDGDDVRVEVELRVEVPLAPGERIELEAVRVALGDDPNRLLEEYAEELGAEAGARTASPFQVGWCSWYHFFHSVTEGDLLRNLDALAKARDEIPVDVVQLDDGYQRAIGDWLETNAKFPRGIAPLAQEIRSAGFRPGLWTAPFCVAPESRVFAAHPEWLLRSGDALHRGLLHPEWSAGGWIHTLDPTRPEVRRHLLRTFAGLLGMGFSYLKLDFLYVVAMQADAFDPRVTRAGRLRRGLEAIREGAGEEAFLLGCGCPLGAAVGLVDGMRIGPDVAPGWAPEPAFQVPGLEPAVPGVRNAVRNVLARAWMHRRLWLNDPDCLMVRSADTELAPEEAQTLASAIAATGGMLLLSDDVPSLSPPERLRIRETLALAREVDSAAPHGAARAIGLTEAEIAHGVVVRGAGSTLLLAVNDSDAAREIEIPLDAHAPLRGALPPHALLGTPDPDPRAEDRLRARIPAHGSLFCRVPGRPRFAVFCDYDGTFAVQDVGSSIAQRYAGERRPQLWERLRRGELTPWEYNLELLDGLRLPEEQLDAFLQTVEPDPGAAALVAFCHAHGIPFRVVSDGFDRNLDRLQELHGIRFAYDANRLWYENGAWRIAAGAPDESCGCGTGICKRAAIARFRALHPDVVAVHVGNGRVSDLCASRAADLVFAKDTLAEELTAQGVAFEPFESLHDVVSGLARRLEGGD